jgi:sugar-specific transcriptional regulator TrmB
MWDIVGIRETEERVYETLARRGHCDVGDLAEATGLPRGRVSKAVTELVDHGMVTRLSGRPTRFVASPPDQVAGSLIAGMEQRLSQLRGHARDLAEQHRRATVSRDHPADLVEIVEGGANVASTFRRLQQQARREVRGFDRPPYLTNPVEGNQEETHQRASRGITYRVVYDRSALTIPGRMADIWAGIHAGELARVGDVPMKMVLCDDIAALIPASTTEYTADAAYLIHPS